jgi:hypothetical protein
MSFAAVLTKLRSGNLSVAEIQSALASIDVEAMEAAAEQLEEDRRRVLVEGNDKDVDAVEAKITLANRDIERAIAAKAELERRLEKAASAETENARKARYKAAKAKSKQAADRVKEYSVHAKAIADLIRLLAEATVAVQAANADLPAGAEPLLDPEFAARGLPGLPAKTIAEEEVTLWYRVGREEIVADVVAKKLDDMDRHSGRNGVLNVASGNEVWPGRYETRKFIRREFVDEERWVAPEPLSKISLPGLVADDLPFWDNFNVSDARSVVARFDQLSQQKPTPREDQRDVKVEYIPVEEKPAVAPADQDAEAA